jgi:ABC-type branched-subunit amino acid transport system ATPase component
MNRVLVNKLHINKVRHLQGISIPLDADSGRIRHLILTGKNGSGKSGVIDAVAGYIDAICERGSLSGMA